jgi:hypothetical protein
MAEAGGVEQSTASVATRFIDDEVWAIATSRWINEKVRSSPIAQSTEAWNHLGIILSNLREYIEDEIQQRSR